MTTYDPANIYGQQMPQQAPQMGQQQPQGQQAGQTLPPELVKAMLALQQQKTTDKGIARQQQMAQALQAQAMEPARATSPGGGMAGAPNWAGALANVAAGYKGKQLSDKAGAAEITSGDQRQIALRKYFDALSSQGGAGGGYMAGEV